MLPPNNRGFILFTQPKVYIEEVILKLEKWLLIKNINTSSFALQIGASRSQVHKYMHEGAIPRVDIMQKIFLTTKKEVTPNDFYGVTLDWQQNEKKNQQKINTEPQF